MTPADVSQRMLNAAKEVEKAELTGYLDIYACDPTRLAAIIFTAIKADPATAARIANWLANEAALAKENK